MKYYLIVSLTELKPGEIPAENIAGEYNSIDDLNANTLTDADKWIKQNAPRPAKGTYKKVFIYQAQTV